MLPGEEQRQGCEKASTPLYLLFSSECPVPPSQTASDAGLRGGTVAGTVGTAVPRNRCDLPSPLAVLPFSVFDSLRGRLLPSSHPSLPFGARDTGDEPLCSGLAGVFLAGFGAVRAGLWARRGHERASSGHRRAPADTAVGGAAP